MNIWRVLDPMSEYISDIHKKKFFIDEFATNFVYLFV